MLLQNIHVVDLEKRSCQKASLELQNGLIAQIHGPDHSGKPGIVQVDLGGAFLIPGFTDSHTHLLAHGIEKQRIDLSGCTSVDDCLDRLNTGEGGEYVFGVNWDESNWRRGKKDALNKGMLDKIAIGRPVIMRRVCGHFAVCNSKALEMIPKEWTVVDRKKGLLYEDAALYLNRLFIPSDAMYFKGLKIAMQEANALGITSVHEITDKRGISIYQKMRDILTLRVALYQQPEMHETRSDLFSTRKFGDDFLKFMGLKMFMDGSIGAMTAAVDRPYAGTKNKGMLLITDKTLVSSIKRAERSSLQLMIHSIGDRATGMAIRAFRKAGLKDNHLRHRLEHLEIISKTQIKEIARFGIIASMQPNFVRWQEPGGMYEKRVGARFGKMNCFDRVKKAGIRVIFGSDCMPLGPLTGIRSAVGHPFKCGRLEPAEAFRLYTEEPSYATFDEYNKGKISPGYFADLVVLDKNPLIKRNIGQLKILKVFVAGKAVHQG